MNALIEAIRHDSLVGVRKILEREHPDLNEATVVCNEFDIDDPDEIPLLFWVIQSDASLDMIEMLISYGMDLTRVNHEGLGALDVAVKHKRMDVVKLCGEHGISYTQSRRRSGMTPLMLAAGFGNREMVDFFLMHGANVSDTDKRGTDAIEYARILGYTDMATYLSEAQKEKQGR
jgi:ankyrin repeat protein